MKNVNFIVFVLLAGLPWGGLNLYARTVTLENGVKIDLPVYRNKQVNSDGSVCVDVNRFNVTATICSYKKATDAAVRSNGFFKYKDLSLMGGRQIPSLPDDALVYAEGGYSFLYPANKKRIGGFVVYEADNILCKTDSDDGERPAVCYAAALVSGKKPDMSPTIFVFSVIEQPPTPGGNLSEKAKEKVVIINEIIRSIKTYR
ncbi:hypothetical protein QZM52_00010 [Burkholderia metallica]|uniref:Uncharacterized protein n=1 Tax=Burkholderia metallica TaxID=488729 RepID=A0ABT8P3Z2_9BURK|nr:hypothetical protein [Burkholderia metallica]MDN7929661.1 hypothetical protein [Burkholderia metallica]